MQLLHLILLAVLIQFTSQCAVQVTNRMYQFSIKLLRSVAENREHFVIAPASAWVNLKLISKGASGDTLRELKTIVQTKKKCKKFYKKIVNQIKSEAYDLISYRVVAVMVNNNMGYDFIGTLRDGYGALVIETTSDDLEENVKSVNAIISSVTRGTVNKSITYDFLSEESMRIIDINYFNAKLEIPLRFDSTKLIEFENEQENYITTVEAMNKTDSFGLISLDIGCLAIEVPLGNMSLIIYLPNKRVKIKAVLEKLSQKMLSDILKDLSVSKIGKMTLLLPKLKIKTQLSLKKHLEEFGISRMFESELAEFANVGQGRNHISKINQYSEFKFEPELSNVDSWIPGRSILTITVNRPFVFMLVERLSNVVVYTGVYSNPPIK